SILSIPHKADKDKPGVISAGEAVILAIALAMDASGAGFAAAILGHSVFITAISVGLVRAIFLYTGSRLGLLLAQSTAMEKFTLLPPILLIGIGVFNFF